MRSVTTLNLAFAALLGFSFPNAARAGDLFNPTPAADMRELSTDRPDKTESPYTVDAGHFQLEMDMVSFTRDRVKTGGEDSTSESYAVAPMNFKLGLSDSIDLQIVVDTYIHQQTTDHLTGVVDRASGFGDITVRTKFNVWGNDDGTTAFAVMPFIKLPTASRAIGNGKVEGGVILPLAVALPGDFGLGLMTEVDINHNDGRAGYHAAWINSITVGKDLTATLGMYVELFTARIFEPGAHRWDNSADVGFTYGLTDNVQLDAGLNIGISEAADDLNPFVGLSVRW